MRTRILAAFVAVAALAMAQKPKSKSENDALIAIQGEKDPAAKITKIDEFVKKYADTEFKEPGSIRRQPTPPTSCTTVVPRSSSIRNWRSKRIPKPITPC